jgi:hypothetical protein
MEVPHFVVYPLVGLLSVEVTAASPVVWHPPAVTMGLRRPSSVGPQEVWMYCVVLLVFEAPTWIGFLAEAGGAIRS